MRRGLLATQSELAALKKRIGRRPFDHIYDALRKRCALILESKPITETMWRSAWAQGRWGAALTATAGIQGRVLDLIICHNIDRNTAYRDRAIEELRNLLRFSTWVDPAHSFVSADLCTGEACATAAIALDWLADELSEADRAHCRQALLAKGFQPYLRAIDEGAFWYSSYHNWNAVVNGGVALAALLLADEDATAAAALAKARKGLERYFGALGREGGWDEGVGYWGYGMRYVLLLGEALARIEGDHSIFGRRGMDATGLFPVYFCPHGVPVSFGDNAQAPTFGTFYLLAKHHGLKEMLWWLDRYGLRHDVKTGGRSHAGLALLFRPAQAKPQPRPKLLPVKAFKQIGWAAAADRWPEPSVYVALKTGDLAASHAQLDMNSVQIMIDGEILLHDIGSPAYSHEYFTPDGRYRFYEAQSRSHNTLAAADREHRIDAVGGIVQATCGRNYRWLAGDAGEALGEDVRFVRHVVMPIPARGAASTLVVLDEVRNIAPERLNASWHTAGKLTLDENGTRGKITGASAALNFAVAATESFEADTRSHSLNTKRTDNVLEIALPATRELLLATVFARRPVGPVKLKRTPKGGLTLTAGRLKLRFRPTPKRLTLDRVETG